MSDFSGFDKHLENLTENKITVQCYQLRTVAKQIAKASKILWEQLTQDKQQNIMNFCGSCVQVHSKGAVAVNYY